MGSERIPVGLIGCGWISRIAHIPNLLSSRRADLVALADLSDSSRAHAMRLVPAARAYRDAGELIADADVQAVVIAAPPNAASRLALDALSAGKHLYLEKPGATSLDEMMAVREAWAGSGRIGVVGYNFRRNPAVEASATLIRSGLLGDLVTIHSVFTWVAGGGGWRDEADSGGALIDLGCHHVDLAMYLADAAVVEADAKVRSIERPGDTADLTLRFETGAVAGIHVSSCAGLNRNGVRLMGSKGHLDLDLVSQRPPRLLQGDPPRTRLRKAAGLLAGLDLGSLAVSGAERSFAAMLDAFLEGCITGRQPQPSIDDAVAVFQTIEMARSKASS